MNIDVDVMDREIVKLEKLAEQGDASAMFELGCMYEKGTTIDIKKAIEWYEKAADLDSRAAMHRLGEIYLKGQGVSQDIEKGIEWYEKATDLNSGYAMLMLGETYLKGQGVPQDYKKSKEWLKKALNLGNLSKNADFMRYVFEWPNGRKKL